MYLSVGPPIDLEKTFGPSKYTRLLWACSSTYDPWQNKYKAISTLVQRGANVRACCEPFHHSSLHLVLLSTRDEADFSNGIWKGDQYQLENILLELVSAGAQIDLRNKAGLSPQDLAIELRCVKGWNWAMETCRKVDMVIDTSRKSLGDAQEVARHVRFRKLWEDYEHFHHWQCLPDTCFGQPHEAWRDSEPCPWWVENEWWKTNNALNDVFAGWTEL